VIGGDGDGGQVRLTGAGGNTISLEALARDRSVVDFRLASIIAQSGVVSPISMTRSETHIARCTVERDEDGTSAEIEPSEVEYGISIHALPPIIDDGRTQLFLTVLQSDLIGGEVKQIGSDNNTTTRSARRNWTSARSRSSPSCSPAKHLCFRAMSRTCPSLRTAGWGR